jgi:hypothetical protein
MSSRRVKISGKSNGRISAQSRGWNCAGPRHRPHHPHRRLRWPRALARPQPAATKTLPIWPSGLKRRCANHRARHAHRPIRHARRRRPIRQRAAIRRHPRRRAVRAAASNARHRPTATISPTKARPPSTTRSNKKWRICSGGRQRAEAGKRRSLAAVPCQPTGIRNTGLIATPDEDSAAARLMSAKS